MAGIVDPIVSTSWLAGRLRDPALRVVDATLPMVGQPGHGRDSYRTGHIPGAIFFDINAIADPSTDLPHMLATPEAFAEAAGLLGLGRECIVVVYDAHGIYSAPRVWWTLRVMGYPRVYVLDGGMKAWRREGRPIETLEANRSPAKVTPSFNPALVADLAGVTTALRTHSADVIDARPGPRFRGEEPEPRAGLRTGHMPGAISLPFDRLVNADGTMKDTQELRGAFRDVSFDRPIITSCGSGVTAAIIALALARMGRDAAVYDGSWAEWGGRTDTAVVTGA